MTRFKWPIPSDEYLHRDLSEWEDSTAQDRIERCRFIWEEFGPPADMLSTSGFPGLFALHELKCSYLYGNFMATVLLAQVFVEQSLGGSYSFSDKEEISNQSFSILIDNACDDGLITPEIADAFHCLRRIRNSYTHFVMGLGVRSYRGRLVKSNCKDPNKLAEEDAKFAIKTVVDFLRNSSPNWNPEKVKWSEEDTLFDENLR